MRKTTFLATLFAFAMTTGCDELLGGSPDSDNDGISDADEATLGTDPTLADTDGDGIDDADEVQLGTDPLEADSDGDGLSDGEEVYDLGTNPNDADTDGDGMDDAAELESGRDPTALDKTLYVLVEDNSPDPAGGAPGADIDTISLIKADGREYFATVVLDDDVDCTGNEACDLDALLGANDVVGDDGACFGDGSVDFSLFAALNAGAVVVSFSTPDEQVTIENGDSVHVWEIGATECGRFDNDPFSVSAGATPVIDAADWTFMGAGGEGDNLIPVEGL